MVYLGFVMGLLVFLVALAVSREFICWYLKQNQVVDLLQEIKKEIQKKNATCESCDGQKWTRYYRNTQYSTELFK